MSIEIKVPQLPESVSDATLVAWHKKAGENVVRDENLVDLETDKVVLEVPAPSSGVLKEIRVEQGTTVNEGDVLALLEEGESAPEAEDAAAGDADDSAGQENTPASSALMKSAQNERSRPVKTSPAVRRLLDEYDLDETMVAGTGRDGRITKADVLNFLKSEEGDNITSGETAMARAMHRRCC